MSALQAGDNRRGRPVPMRGTIVPSPEAWISILHWIQSLGGRPQRNSAVETGEDEQC